MYFQKYIVVQERVSENFCFLIGGSTKTNAMVPTVVWLLTHQRGGDREPLPEFMKSFHFNMFKWSSLLKKH